MTTLTPITVTTGSATMARKFENMVAEIPGAVRCRYLGGKRAQIITTDDLATEKWVLSSTLVKSHVYE